MRQDSFVNLIATQGVYGNPFPYGGQVPGDYQFPTDYGMNYIYV